MRLSDFLEKQVSRNCRTRGYEYFVSGAVRDLGLDAGAIVATVVGSEGYDITLEPDNTFLRASCTCPFFFDRSEICKHIWATILAAEARNLPLTAPGTPPSLVILEADQPDVES